MDLYLPIESAERQFKQILEEYFISVFDDRSLSSHGIDHHRRVWNYAKDILPIIENKTPFTIASLSTKLIITCYLHDIGMSVEKGIRHGKHSREICSRFINQCQLPLNNYEDVLEAIEYHDIKDYSASAGTNELLKILSVADDLDAFGFTGVFRYSEIYLLRGITPKEMGIIILKNADKRFENFKKQFQFSNKLFKKHQKRYNILKNFFFEYNTMALTYKFGGKYPSGYCGIIDIIANMIRNNSTPNEIFDEMRKHQKDPVIFSFLNGLKSELS